ncbi:hypothetical protein BC830DRAFT_1146641 [Chytriomyces sp. MP71]|nr:hypothetical protein BC830DRAFT_1146641 [Chytriomyces sp. MP71]
MLPISDARASDKTRNEQLVSARRQLAPAPAPPALSFSFRQLPRPPMVSFGAPQPTDASDKEREKKQREKEDAPVVLVPIKLDFDMDTSGFRLRDHFFWNLNEAQITPWMFSQQLVQDFRLPPQATEEISKAITEQLADFYDHSYIRPPLPAQGIQPPLVPLPPLETLSSRDKTEKQRPPEVHVYDHPNLRVTLKIDVSIGNVSVMDNIEWDINCSSNSPERFSEVLCAEMGLSMEFQVAIAHQLRDQIQVYHKSLFALDHPFDDSEIGDEDLWYNHFLPPVTAALRAEDQKTFAGPTILTGALPGAGSASVEDKSAAARRKRLSTTARTRGRNALPERDVSRFWMSALPVWRNGVKKGTMPRGVPLHMLPGTAGGVGGGGGLYPKRRTRQDAAAEQDVGEATAGGEGALTALGSKKQDIIMKWNCRNCKLSVVKTELARPGPDGPLTLCNDCGLHFSRTGQLPSKNSHANEEIARNWFAYPKVVDASTREISP